MDPDVHSWPRTVITRHLCNDGDGRIDYRVVNSGWDIELLCNGDRLVEHCKRFEPNGRYYKTIHLQQGDLVDWLVIDFTHRNPNKFTDVPNAKLMTNASAKVLDPDNEVLDSEFPLCQENSYRPHCRTVCFHFLWHLISGWLLSFLFLDTEARLNRETCSFFCHACFKSYAIRMDTLPCKSPCVFWLSETPSKKNRENRVLTTIATNTTTTLKCPVRVLSKGRLPIPPICPPPSRQMHHPLALLHQKSHW